MGTHGDLGTTLKWKLPFPDMTEVFKTYTKKSINDAVSLINARKETWEPIEVCVIADVDGIQREERRDLM